MLVFYMLATDIDDARDSHDGAGRGHPPFMANFNTHISVATLASMTATAVCIQKVGLSDEQAVILFFLGAIAGMLPDIDLDHSIPAQWLFHFLTFSTVTIVALYAYERLPPLQLTGLLVGVWFIMRYIILNIFRAITVHRGLFHSVPAAGLFGISVYYIGHYLFAWSDHFSWFAAAFVTGGYLVHLILDEIYSVDFSGRSLKQSFGSALTLINKRSCGAYLLLYLLLATSTLYALNIPS